MLRSMASSSSADGETFSRCDSVSVIIVILQGGEAGRGQSGVGAPCSISAALVVARRFEQQGNGGELAGG